MTIRDISLSFSINRPFKIIETNQKINRKQIGNYQITPFAQNIASTKCNQKHTDILDIGTTVLTPPKVQLPAILEYSNQLPSNDELPQKIEEPIF